MGFFIGILYFVGFIFYLIAAFAAFGMLIGFMSNDSEANQRDGSFGYHLLNI